jgi:hypothetical protein
MEMTFPHFAPRQEPDSGQAELKAVLDAARVRQANSNTARALRQAEQGIDGNGGNLAARIQYFALEPEAREQIRGSFWQQPQTEKINEESVYQDALANVKDPSLSTDGTGPELNPAGHGALPKS